MVIANFWWGMQCVSWHESSFTSCVKCLCIRIKMFSYKQHRCHYFTQSTPIAHKIVVTATCIHLYPRVENCLELASVYMYPSTYRRIQVAHLGYLYPVTCIWCKRGLKVFLRTSMQQIQVNLQKMYKNKFTWTPQSPCNAGIFMLPKACHKSLFFLQTFYTFYLCLMSLCLAPQSFGGEAP